MSYVLKEGHLSRRRRSQESYPRGRSSFVLPQTSPDRLPLPPDPLARLAGRSSSSLSHSNSPSPWTRPPPPVLSMILTAEPLTFGRAPPPAVEAVRGRARYVLCRRCEAKE